MNEEHHVTEEQLQTMPLVTAEKLYSAQIRTRLLGYCKEEVDMLLEEAAATLDMLRQENDSFREKTEALEEELKKYQDMESSLRASLISSQKMGEAMIASAQLQADALVEEARLAKERAVFKMEQLPVALQAEIERLTGERDQLRQDLRAILQAHGALIDTIPTAESREETTLQKNAASTSTAKKEEHNTESVSASPAKESDQDQENDNAYVDL
ncbi:MAG: DivIVA domain-containing protein [Candidatus Hydrogenedens sp.]|jgi:cell division initiation protein|nr:DivIVA domain-containing protein [Candidatus Hydrogenedens sp.]